MRKKYQFNIFIILIIFILLHCKKAVQDTIIFGKTEDLKVTTFRKELNFEDFDIDVDGNGTGDLFFYFTYWGSPGLGYHPHITCRVLNNHLKLQYYLATDTTFFHQKLNYFLNSNNQVEGSLQYYFSCRRSSQTDSIVRFYQNREKIGENDKNDILKKSMLFTQNELTVSEEPYFHHGNTFYQHDTAILEWFNYQNNCSCVPKGRFIFLGFIMEDKNYSRLGWVQYKVVNNSTIYLEDCAIQK